MMGVAGNAVKYVPEVVKKGQPNWEFIATLQRQKTKHKYILTTHQQLNYIHFRLDANPIE